MHYKRSSRIVRGTIMNFALAAGAALALLVTGSASAQMVNTTRPYASTIVNPCNGESIAFSGSIHFHEKTQVSNDGRIHFVANNSFSAAGTGQSTGRPYNVGGNMHTNSKFPTFPITFRQRTRVISYGVVDNFHATFAFHINGGGVQTNVTTTSDCKG